MRIREAQRRLREGLAAGGDIAAFAKQQKDLIFAAQLHEADVKRTTGLGLMVKAVEVMTAAGKALDEGDAKLAIEHMQQAEALMKQDISTLSRCMGQLGLVFGEEEYPELRPESALVKQVFPMAVNHRVLFRESCATGPDAFKGFAARLSEFEQALGPFIAEAKTHKNPVKKGEEPDQTPANLHLKLESAKQHFAKAVAATKKGDRGASIASQDKAAEVLRHFVIEYAMKFLKAAGSAPPPPPAPTDVFTEKQDEFELFMPGAVTGVRPPDGRAEWEVLGKRDRAALNENFARELPLEHRDILKNYYERLVK